MTNSIEQVKGLREKDELRKKLPKSAENHKTKSVP